MFSVSASVLRRPHVDATRSRETPDVTTRSGKSVPAVIRLSALVLWSIPLVSITAADPDLWGHLTFGRDIVANWKIDAVDPYSFTSDRPWINHEWLAEVLMYLAYEAAGPVGLVILKTAVLLLVIGCVIAAWRHRRLRGPHEALLIGLALFAMFPRYMTIRPQIFSLVCFALELLILSATERGNRRPLLWMPIIFIVWANAHGGFIVGLGVLGVWAALQALRTPARSVPALAVAGASTAATLVNPYGVGLWRFLWETVGTSRPDIADWTPALSAGAPLLLPWFLLVLTAAYAVWRARRTGIQLSAVVIVALLAIGTLRIGRLDAFLALSVVMLLGPVFGRPREEEERAGNLRRTYVPAGVALLVVTSLWTALIVRSPCVDMSLWHYPEPEATAFLEGQSGRLLTPFNWGEYAIWHLPPALRVSMDGRRETVYSEALFYSHQRLLRGEPGSTALVGDLAPDFVWLPVWSPAIVALERDGWQPAFKGPVSIVLARHVAGPPVVVEQPASGPRCFPQR